MERQRLDAFFNNQVDLTGNEELRNGRQRRQAEEDAHQHREEEERNTNMSLYLR